MKFTVRYPSILMTAVVAGVYSLVVCALLVADAANRLTKVPLDSPEFLALKEQFSEQPDNEELKEKIRSLDLALRKEYFREQQFTKNGVFLLLGGVVVMLVTGKWAATLRRKLPQPTVKLPGPDSDERLSRYGLWAVTALVLALVGTIGAMNVSYRSLLPATLEELAVLQAQPQSHSGTKVKPVSSQPTIPEPPTPEEYRQSWPRFRGPDGSGISAHTDVPTEWDAASGKGIVWKTAVPLPGVNSPIVWKDRVFLTGATKDRCEVYCFDAAEGKILWQKEVIGKSSASPQPLKVGKDTGYAAPTMATDGRFVYAMFAAGELAAFDFSGKEVWQLSLGVPKNSYGHAASLATYKQWVILQFDQGKAKDDLSKLLVLDGATGRTIWQVTRQVPSSWSSPIVVEYKGQPQIITCGDPWVIAYSPLSGAKIWQVNCFEGVEIGPSPVYSDGTVFVTNEYAKLSAIRVDGSDDVTETHIEWQADQGLPEACSPLATDRFVLLMASYGVLTCYDRSKGGDPLWEEDFEEDFTSSPSLVGEYVYLFSKAGRGWIVQPSGEECKRIAEANLGEECVTSPAFQNGRIYIRGKEHLFCIGNN